LLRYCAAKKKSIFYEPGLEEGVARHDRVKKKVNAGERSNVSGGGAGRLKATTTCGPTNATVHAGGEAAERAGEKEGGERPLLFGDGVTTSVDIILSQTGYN
jgi:hypothetical protein